MSCYTNPLSLAAQILSSIQNSSPLSDSFIALNWISLKWQIVISARRHFTTAESTCTKLVHCSTHTDCRYTLCKSLIRWPAQILWGQGWLLDRAVLISVISRQTYLLISPARQSYPNIYPVRTLVCTLYIYYTYARYNVSATKCLVYLFISASLKGNMFSILSIVKIRIFCWCCVSFPRYKIFEHKCHSMIPGSMGGWVSQLTH